MLGSIPWKSTSMAAAESRPAQVAEMPRRRATTMNDTPSPPGSRGLAEDRQELVATALLLDPTTSSVEETETAAVARRRRPARAGARSSPLALAAKRAPAPTTAQLASQVGDG